MAAAGEGLAWRDRVDPGESLGVLIRDGPSVQALFVPESQWAWDQSITRWSVESDEYHRVLQSDKPWEFQGREDPGSLQWQRPFRSVGSERDQETPVDP